MRLLVDLQQHEDQHAGRSDASATDVDAPPPTGHLVDGSSGDDYRQSGERKTPRVVAPRSHHITACEQPRGPSDAAQRIHDAAVVKRTMDRDWRKTKERERDPRESTRDSCEAPSGVIVRVVGDKTELERSVERYQAHSYERSARMRHAQMQCVSGASNAALPCRPASISSR